MKLLIMTLLGVLMCSCASTSVSRNLSFVSFDELPTDRPLVSAGPIEGRDCTWYLFGYGLGPHPTVRDAFLSAVQRQKDQMIPGKAREVAGAPLKVVKGVSVEDDGFNAYIARRSCVVVTGAGFQ